METQEEFAKRWTAEYRTKRARTVQWVLELREVTSQTEETSGSKQKRNKKKKEIQLAQNGDDLVINWNHSRMRDTLRIYFYDNLRLNDMTNLHEDEAPVHIDIDPDFWPDVLGILRQLQRRDLAVNYGMDKYCELLCSTEIDQRVTSPSLYQFGHGSEEKRSCQKSVQKDYCEQTLSLKRSKNVRFLNAKIVLYIQTHDEKLWKGIPVNGDSKEVQGKMIRDISIREMKKEYTGHLDAECNSKYTVITLSHIRPSTGLYRRVPPIWTKSRQRLNDSNRVCIENPEAVSDSPKLLPKTRTLGASLTRLPSIDSTPTKLDNNLEDNAVYSTETPCASTHLQPALNASAEYKHCDTIETIHSTKVIPTANDPTATQMIDTVTEHLEITNTFPVKISPEQKYADMKVDEPKTLDITIQSQKYPVQTDQITKSQLNNGDQLKKSQESLLSDDSLNQAINEILCNENVEKPRRRNGNNWQNGLAYGGGDRLKDEVTGIRKAEYRKDGDKVPGTKGCGGVTIPLVQLHDEPQHPDLTDENTNETTQDDQIEAGVTNDLAETAKDPAAEKVVKSLSRSSSSMGFSSAKVIKVNKTEQQREFPGLPATVISPDEDKKGIESFRDCVQDVQKGATNEDVVPPVGQLSGRDDKITYTDDCKIPPVNRDKGRNVNPATPTPVVKLRQSNKLRVLSFLRRQASHLRSKLQSLNCRSSFNGNN